GRGCHNTFPTPVSGRVETFDGYGWSVGGKGRITVADLPLELRLEICAELPRVIEAATSTARDALQHALFVEATLSQYENVMPDLGPRIERLFVGTAAAWSAFHLQRIDRPNDLGFKFPQGLRPASLLEAVSGRTSCGRIQGRSSAEIAHKLAVHVR